MRKDLEKQAEELEQTLQKQLELAKKDSEDWLKVGGVVLVGGIVAYSIVRLSQGAKPNKSKQAMELLKKEGLLDEQLKKQLKGPVKSSFWPRLGQGLLLLGLAYAKNSIVQNAQNPSSESPESRG